MPGVLGATEVMLRDSDLTEVAPGIRAAPSLAIAAPDPTVPLTGRRAPQGVGALLQRAEAEGPIAGFADVLYDNRDRGHSALPPEAYPRLPRLVYGSALRERQDDYGLARFLLPAVVLGNSSTAVTAGPNARSLPRLAMTTATGPVLSAQLYFNNHLYLYPEHRDHDAEDRFPANWPYSVISQGSSGSDQAFLQALAGTLAAFPKATFTAMRADRLVAPTLQMILRRNLTTARTREAYITGAAHPVVFDGATLRTGAMVAMAAEMQPEDIPPGLRLSVIEETFRSEAGLAGLSEQLFTTPAAVARIWRDTAWAQEMVVAASAFPARPDRPVRFSWHLLRGDPARVQIVPIEADGSRVRIRLAWHDPWSERARLDGDLAERRLSRLDIGVFAETEDTISAPAFLSVSFPAHQSRAYGLRGNDIRLLSVDYNAQARDRAYDPVLHWSAPWTDRASYASDGRLQGWSRRFADGRDRFVPLGSETYEIDRSDPARPALRPDAP